MNAILSLLKLTLNMIKNHLHMRFFPLLFFIAFVISCSGQPNSNTPDSIENEKASEADSLMIGKLDEFINDYVEYGKFNGAVLVAKEGKIIYKKGFGWANMEWDIPNQPDTKFRIASITKQFTAMLIVQLVAEKKLDLHTPISAYLPDYPKENGDSITIHHLLTHTSGTPEFDLYLNYRDIERNRYKPEELIDLFADQPLQFSPGEKYEYSNPGYIILGVIIEKITGKSYEQVLQEKILKPLKMTNSGYDHQYNVLRNRASGYSRGYLRNDYYNTNYVDMSIPYAAGSIYSTVEDLYLWDQALYTDELLPEKYRDLLFGKYIPTRRRYYGYGWFIAKMFVGKTDELVEINRHGGGINGFSTMITRIPSNKSLVVLLNNIERAPLYEMTVAINGIIHGKPFNPKKSTAYTLLDVIKKDGKAAGNSYYERVKDSVDFYHDLHEMNIAGYELLFADNLDEALFLFKLNCDEFPDSFEVYDSYAEGLMTAGDTEQSIENYMKSVELNPSNKNGIRMLKKQGVDIESMR